MITRLLLCSAPACVIVLVAGCTIVTTDANNDAGPGTAWSGGESGAAGISGAGGRLAIPRDAAPTDGQTVGAGGKTTGDATVPEGHVPSSAGELCDPGSESFQYSGSAPYDGQNATMHLTFSGGSLSGALHKDGVCDSNNIRLQRVDISFNASFYDGKTWESPTSVLQGSWSGGDYDCDGNLMAGYPTSGEFWIWKEGDEILACRSVDAEGYCVTAYTFRPTNQVYDSSCAGNDAGPPITLPAGCYQLGAPACNPLTNSGCLGEEACDYGLNQAGNMVLGCYSGDNSVANGGPCDNQNGPWCLGTNHCNGTPGTCSRFCCADSDCGEGTCVAFDPSNVGTLGTCDRSTPTGVFTLASSQDHPNAIAVDNANVYWLNVAGGYGAKNGSVMKVPVAGGTPVVLASGQGDPTGIAVDQQSVYWTNQSDGTVLKVPISGGDQTILASAQSGPSAIAVQGEFLYWCNQSGSAIMKVEVGGGTPSIVVGANCAYGLVVDLDSLYWPSGSGGKGVVMKVSTTADVSSDASPPASAIATDQPYPWGIALGGNRVYWTNLTIGTGSVVSATTDGQSPVTLVTDQPYPWSVAVDGANAYFTNGGGSSSSGNTVMKVPLSGGSPTTLATDQGNPVSIAVDSSSVYWCNSSEGTVRKTAK